MSTLPVTTKSPTAGMTCEWYSRPEFCQEACADALPRFSLDLVRIVVKLLKNPDARVYDVKAIQSAYGKEELEDVVGGPVHELPMPLEFEALLQRDLADVFCPSACAIWEGKQKVYEVFSVYFKPPNLSPSKSEKLALKWEGHFYVGWEPDQSLQPHLHTVEAAASWILFPDLPAGIDLGLEDAPSLIPEGFREPSLGDASYCLFTQFACGQAEDALITKFIRTTEGNLDASVASHGLHYRGICLMFNPDALDDLGIAPIMKRIVNPSAKSA